MNEEAPKKRSGGPGTTPYNTLPRLGSFNLQDGDEELSEPAVLEASRTTQKVLEEEVSWEAGKLSGARYMHQSLLPGPLIPFSSTVEGTNLVD